MPKILHTTYQRFVFAEMRELMAAWLEMNPQDFALTPNQIAFLGEKIGDMAWRRLADEKSMDRILYLEIGLPRPEAPPVEPGARRRRVGKVRGERRQFEDDGVMAVG